MKRTASCLALLCAAACHEPFSNEDLLFLKSLPRDVQFDVPDEGERTGSGLSPQQAMPAQFAIYYNAMVEVAQNTNVGVFDLLRYVETITSSSATVREDDRRVWGPIRPEEAKPFELLLVVDRVKTSSTIMYTSLSESLDTKTFYRFAFSGRQTSTTAWVQLLYGESVVLSADEDEATGYFCVDLEQATMLDPKDEGTGMYCVSYDYRGDQRTVELAVRAPGSIYVNPDAAFSFHRERDGSGRFFFSERKNVFPEDDPSVPEISSVTVRWDETLAARADVSVCGGDARYELWATECWDENFAQTFLLSNIPGFPIAGALAMCPTEFRETDALAQPCRDE